MGVASRALGAIAALAFVACGGPIDARLPGGVPEAVVSAQPEAQQRAPAAPAGPVATASSDGPGFGGSGTAGLEANEATEAVSAQQLLWTRNLLGGMGFRPVGR